MTAAYRVPMFLKTERGVTISICSHVWSPWNTNVPRSIAIALRDRNVNCAWPVRNTRAPPSNCTVTPPATIAYGPAVSLIPGTTPSPLSTASSLAEATVPT